MAVREFVDSNGVRWRVWSTQPSTSVTLRNGFEDGWLTFESASSLRRLVPVPEGWAAAGVQALERWCRSAPEVPRHTGPLTRAVDPGA